MGLSPGVPDVACLQGGEGLACEEVRTSVYGKYEGVEGAQADANVRGAAWGKEGEGSAEFRALGAS